MAALPRSCKERICPVLNWDLKRSTTSKLNKKCIQLQRPSYPQKDSSVITIAARWPNSPPITCPVLVTFTQAPPGGLELLFRRVFSRFRDCNLRHRMIHQCLE